jgi:hypothetical protein
MCFPTNVAQKSEPGNVLSSWTFAWNFEQRNLFSRQTFAGIIGDNSLLFFIAFLTALVTEMRLATFIFRKYVSLIE